MNQKALFALWGGLFSLCAGLGFIPEPAGLLRGVLTALSILCFAPPAVLLYQAAKQQDVRTLLLLRNLSALSLGLTALLLVLSFATAMASEWVGTLVYYVLVVLSSPMVCSGYWALSLFLWACLLMASLNLHHRKGGA